MCGIGGWLCLTNASRVDPKTLLRMRDTIHIGGPMVPDSGSLPMAAWDWDSGD